MLKRLALLGLFAIFPAQAQQYFSAPDIIGERANGGSVNQGSAPSQQQINQIEMTAVGQQYPGTSRYHTVTCSTGNISAQQCWGQLTSSLYTALGGATTFGSCVAWTQGTLTGGSSYTAGTYTNVPMTGGSGAGARGTMTVAGGAVTGVTFTVQPPGYAASDSLSATAANLGGTGSGFSIVINSISGTNGCTTSSPGTTAPAGNSDRLFWNPGLHKQVVFILGDSITKDMFANCCGSGFFTTINGPYPNALMPVGVKTFQTTITNTSQFWEHAVMTRLWNVPWSRLVMGMGNVGWGFSTIPGYTAGDYTSTGQWLLNTQMYQYLTFANNQQAVIVVQVGTNDTNPPSAAFLANSTLTCTSNVVTVTTAAPHTIPNTQAFTVGIAGVTPSGYNGNYAATSTGASTFTYPIGACPAAETVPGTYHAALYGSPTQGWPSLAGYLQTVSATIKANWPNANNGAGPYLIVMTPIARVSNAAGFSFDNNTSYVNYANYVAANMAALNVSILIRFDNVAPLSPPNAATVIANSTCYSDITTHPTPYCAQRYEWSQLKLALDRIQFGTAVSLPSNIFTVNGV